MFIKNGDLQPITILPTSEKIDVEETKNKMSKALNEASKNAGKIVPVSKKETN